MKFALLSGKQKRLYEKLSAALYWVSMKNIEALSKTIYKSKLCGETSKAMGFLTFQSIDKVTHSFTVP